MPWQGLSYLRDYCYNATVAGISYVANPNLHFIERIFWLMCVVIATVGSALLIFDYDTNFESTAVSIVYEMLPPHQKIHFPSLAICDAMENNEEIPLVMEMVDSLSPGKYDYDLEMIITLIMFPQLHTTPKLKAICEVYNREPDNPLQCPKSLYRQLAHRLLTNCTNYFIECKFNDISFDCCHYFVAQTTPYGKCYLLNSLLNNKPERWFDLSLMPLIDKPRITITAKRPMDAFLLNREDMPIYSLPSVNAKASARGEGRIVDFVMETMLNDDDVQEISPMGRHCRFPNEPLPESRYKAYSFTTCYADCVRSWQLRLCNCSLFTYLPEDDPHIDECDYVGFVCVDEHQLVQPNPKIMLPWSPVTPCNCLPSCTETDLLLIHEEIEKLGTKSQFNVSFHLADWPSHRFRRQALRTRLDVVVSIGGILGLFMGVSILSFIELVYYFSIRLCNTWRATTANRN